MLKTNRKNKAQNGFTLIEVMIVLAIAGLIMLVVFLAVPALQRNARNTQRREDAGNVLSAVSEYVANNDGTVPKDVQGSQGSKDLTLGGTGTNTTPVKLGIYDADKVTIKAYATTDGYAPDESNMIIITGATCGASNKAASSTSTRSVIILYMLENKVNQCRQS